jgi:hypothetical protein
MTSLLCIATRSLTATNVFILLSPKVKHAALFRQPHDALGKNIIFSRAHLNFLTLPHELYELYDGRTPISEKLNEENGHGNVLCRSCW